MGTSIILQEEEKSKAGNAAGKLGQGVIICHWFLIGGDREKC